MFVSTLGNRFAVLSGGKVTKSAAGPDDQSRV